MSEIAWFFVILFGWKNLFFTIPPLSLATPNFCRSNKILGVFKIKRKIKIKNYDGTIIEVEVNINIYNFDNEPFDRLNIIQDYEIFLSLVT